MNTKILIPTAGFPRDNFFVFMALGIVAVVVFGFSHTVVENLIRPAYPRPLILYIHSVVFPAWLLLFTVQVTLVSSGHIDWHRRLGVLGVCLGCTLPPVGVATAIAMTRLRVSHGEMDAAGSFLIPCWDIVCFTTAFVLAVRWRHRPAFHRRLMLVATAALTAAGWGRWPLLDHAEWFYSGVDLLVAIAALRDLLVDRRIHVVYLVALPALIVGQFLLAALRWSPWWLATAPGLFR